MLIPAPFPPEEGIGYYVYNLTKKLQSYGHEVTIVTRGKTAESENIEGIKLIKLPFVRLYPFHIQLHGRYVNNYLRKHKDEFDLIHVHTPLAPIPKTKLPVVCTVHTSVVGDSEHIEVVDLKSLFIKLYSPTMGKYLVSKLIRSSRCVMTVSPAIANELERFYCYQGAVIVGNGINPEEFVVPNENKERDYLLYVGRLSYRKGVLDLIKAIEIVSKEREIHLIVCGKGDIEKELVNYVDNNHLQKQVIFKGHVSRLELIELYKSAKAFILPSHYEGLPTTLLEAMAARTPVIVSDIPAIKGLIEDGVNGLLYETGSIKELSEKIVILLKDEQLADTMSINGYQTIVSGYTWDTITRAILRCYDQAIVGVRD